MAVDTDDEILINPALCFTKSAYARLINKSPTWVDILVDKKKLKTVIINGGSFIVANHVNKPQTEDTNVTSH